MAARKLIGKELVNSRLLKEYASWIYCSGCQKTVAYLCYVTYATFDFTYTCSCGSKGEVHLSFTAAPTGKTATAPLVTRKNRQCCPADNSPLVTFVEKNLLSYECSLVCVKCNTRYTVAKGREQKT